MPSPTLAIGLVGTAASASAQKKAASSAAAAQTQASEAGIAEQARQFDAVRELLKPFVETGTDAQRALANLAGLGGAEAQQAAIQGIEQSPELASMVSQGEQAILANAAATGGLRGGNTQAALAKFRPAMLSQQIATQYGRLGGLASMGQASAAGQAAAAQQFGANVSDLLQQSGAAQAGAALARGQATANMWGGIGAGVGNYFGQAAGTNQATILDTPFAAKGFW